MPTTEAVATFAILNHRGRPAFFREGAAGNVDLKFISFCGDLLRLAGELDHVDISNGESMPLKTPKAKGHYWFTVFRKGDSARSQSFVLAVQNKRIQGFSGVEDPCFSIKEDENGDLLVSVAKKIVSWNGGDKVPVDVFNGTGDEVSIDEKTNGVETGTHLIPSRIRPTRIDITFPGREGVTTLGPTRTSCTYEYRILQTGGTDQADIVFP